MKEWQKQRVIIYQYLNEQETTSFEDVSNISRNDSEVMKDGEWGIISVTNSPAEEAGLQPNDFIVEMM